MNPFSTSECPHCGLWPIDGHQPTCPLFQPHIARLTELEDHHAIACNILEPTKTASEGTLAYVINPNPGSGGERVELLIRSRGGRWIRKWEHSRRVGNFRAKTIPPEHPLYDRDLCPPQPDILRYLRQWHETEAG